MITKRRLYSGAAAIALALAVAPLSAGAQQVRPGEHRATEIGGVVRGPNGPEAGVWVIAETSDLPTRMIKTVVTDDQGRYVIPDLPKANYAVWSALWFGRFGQDHERARKIVEYDTPDAEVAKPAAAVFGRSGAMLIFRRMFRSARGLGRIDQTIAADQTA